MHWALMALPRADEQTVLFTAGKLGLDLDKLQEDMKAPEIDAHLSLSSELTQAFGFNGTPSFVIGDELVPGAISFEQLQVYVEAAREE